MPVLGEFTNKHRNTFRLSALVIQSVQDRISIFLLFSIWMRRINIIIIILGTVERTNDTALFDSAAALLVTY